MVDPTRPPPTTLLNPNPNPPPILNPTSRRPPHIPHTTLKTYLEPAVPRHERPQVGEPHRQRQHGTMLVGPVREPREAPQVPNPRLLRPPPPLRQRRPHPVARAQAPAVAAAAGRAVAIAAAAAAAHRGARDGVRGGGGGDAAAGVGRERAGARDGRDGERRARPPRGRGRGGGVLHLCVGGEGAAGKGWRLGGGSVGRSIRPPVGVCRACPVCLPVVVWVDVCVDWIS